MLGLALVLGFAACSEPRSNAGAAAAGGPPSSMNGAASPGTSGASNVAEASAAKAGANEAHGDAAPASANGASPQAPVSKPAATSTSPRVPIVDGYTIVNTFPHDSSSFTQGLLFDGGRLLESQGQYGESSLRQVELETGKVLKRVALEPRYFAEGCAVLKGLVYQLTWREGVVLVYDARDLRPVGSFPLAGEGWGLATDGESLIVSDGTDVLRFVDPTTKLVTRRVSVRSAGRALTQLNELEWIEGELWANVWHTELLARIDPKTGEVAGYVDLRGLLPAAERRDAESVLNGIAYDAAKKRIFVTGKRWPKLFELRVQKRT